VSAFERAFILRALEQADGNVSATARTLGVPLSTLKHRMARLEVREVARRLRPPSPPRFPS
jgi:DNA-binding NtrC family response regulator